MMNMMISQMSHCTLAEKVLKNGVVCLPVVPRMASAERDVLHLEEVTTSVILKMETEEEEVDLNR